MISEAQRYKNAALSWYDVARCPVHHVAVGMLNGRLSGQCDGCATEAARGIRRLRKLSVAARAARVRPA